MKKIENVDLKSISPYLHRGDYRKLLLSSAVQVGLAFLDLIGVALIGIIGALTVTGINSTKPGSKVSQVLQFLEISERSFQSQIAILSFIASLLLVSRTFLSVVVTRRTLFFLSRRGSEVSAELIARMFAQPLESIRKRSTQENVYALTTGVQSLTLNVLGVIVTAISDATLLIILTFGLFIVDWFTATATVVLFLLVSIVIYWATSSRAEELGNQVSTLGVESSEKLVTMIEGYREFVVRSRRAYISAEIGKIRRKLAHTEAEIQFMPHISKYVIEVAIILGAVFISMIQFLMNDSIHAIGTLTIFIAAGSRIAPAVMRLQQSAMTFKRGIGTSRATLLLLSQLKNIEPLENAPQNVNFDHSDFTPIVVAHHIDFGYGNGEEEILHDISFEVFAGESLAIVGPSGGGKSTLIDIVLGILVPQAGEASISNLSPGEALRRWPGSVGYVPQDIVLTSGTIRDNVALGFPMEKANDLQIWDALEVARIEDYVRQLPEGIDTKIGDRGFMLSGGQKQRLGIARAMFTKPKLLILDEATSALDAQVESEIAASLTNLKGKVTLVTVAHRLSTVKNADKVLYLENGKVRALGNFEAVRAKVPNFDSQAKLMGL